MQTLPPTPITSAQVLPQKHLQPYYTTSLPIVRYMASMLDVQPAMRILEPSAGEGALVEAVIEWYSDAHYQIDAFDIDHRAVAHLQERYRENAAITVAKRDVLIDTELHWYASTGGLYDRIIANPPFGAWQSPERRKHLKNLFPDFYVKETYSLFQIFALRLLREGGKMVFIVPDTFLSLTMHTALRAALLKETKISEIILFPSSFFPNITFGYGNLCIITAEKSNDTQACFTNHIQVIQGLSSVQDLQSLAISDRVYPEHSMVQRYSQQEFYTTPNHRFFCTQNTKISQYFRPAGQTLIGDIADCVTGFYSGNDKLFLRRSPENPKGNRYNIIEQETIADEQEQQQERERSGNLMKGFAGQKRFLPFVKGGNTRYHKPDMWFMDWSKEAVQEFRTNKKSRLQNTSYYFREGLAVPMVSSSSITASMLKKRLFDQSIVGIFLRDDSLEMQMYLLAFFNSPVCNTLIRSVNRTANNSANYIKQIPLIIPSDTVLCDISATVQDIIEELYTFGNYTQAKENHIHRFISELYDI